MVRFIFNGICLIKSKGISQFLIYICFCRVYLLPATLQSPFGVQCLNLKKAGVSPSRVFFARKCFIPRREIRSISCRGPIEVSFHLLNFGLERVYWTSKTYRVYRVFFLRKCFIVTGGTGGTVRTGGMATKSVI